MKRSREPRRSQSGRRRGGARGRAWAAVLGAQPAGGIRTGGLGGVPAAVTATLEVSRVLGEQT